MGGAKEGGGGVGACSLLPPPRLRLDGLDFVRSWWLPPPTVGEGVLEPRLPARGRS